MGGFTDDDWGARSTPPRRRRARFAADAEVYVCQVAMRPEATVHEATVDAARAHLVAKAERWTTEHGYTIDDATWETVPPAGPDDNAILRLTCQVTPRMDGEWPAIRAAIAEDIADREAARAGRETVDARLERLRRSSVLWGDPVLRGL